MKNKISSIGIVCLLVIGFLIGFIDLGSEWAKGTIVSGTVYDGFGGPWTPAGSPYIVIGDVAIPTGETLTIHPDVEVKFDGYYSIYVEGILNAIGNETNRITITSNSATPMPGDWDGIWIYFKGHAEIEYCDISYGFMALSLGSGNNITNNNIYLNGLYGIVACSSSNNNIIGNNISYSQKHGIFFNGSSNNNITNNNIFSNSYHGICLSASNLNIIVGNNISNNLNGIYLNDLNNKIYHNNFINNTHKQAIDGSNNGNQWNNSYPSGGNYWSDFDEPNEGAYDDYQGPEQNVTGSDNIVDNGSAAGGGKNPYVLDADSQDEYPLMKPFGTEPINPSEYSIFLFEGWNLISIPFIQSNTHIDTVLSPISGAYDAVQWYNVNDPSDHWKHHHILKPSYMNDLNNIDHTLGFWIHITQPGGVIFDYLGTQPIENQKITLYPGWNLVGYPSLCDRTRTEALNNINITTDVDSIWTYNDLTQKWDEMDESDYFEVGRGYWIHSLITKTWEVPK